MFNFLKNENFGLKNSNHHTFFLFLLSINYLFPLLLFGKITLFYHDALDIEIVYNKVIGDIYRNGFEASNILLAGEVKAFYLRRLFQPYMFFYSFLNSELAYWIIDILVKLTSYFSMYLLAKKINKNLFFCSLAACLFASINLPTHEGFGIAIFPYLLYLILFKKKIKYKNYLIIFFAALNTDIVRILISVIVLPIILFIIDKKKIFYNFKNVLKIFLVFLIGVSLANSNLIFIQLFDGPFHREEFYRDSLAIVKNLKLLFVNFFEIPNELNWTFFYRLPLFLYFVPVFLISLILRNNIIYKLIVLLFAIYFYLFCLKLNLVNEARYSSKSFIGSFGWGYIFTIIPLIKILILSYTLKFFNKSRLFFIYLLFPIILLQLNSSMVPLSKKYFFDKEKNYKNVYTFKGYYSYKDYSEIKKIVKDNRVLSIGLDPMVAIMNNIKTIDGYQTLYPLDYKKKFRYVIKDEIEDNEQLKKYYDNWGSRVYAFVNNQNNIKIDYIAAKKLGAEFILSNYELNSKLLTFKCNECLTNLYLYKIN